MKTYGDLNLAKIRDDNDLDFAHFTYLPGMCSCCFGPLSFPKKYWKNREIKNSGMTTFILFENSDNGQGIKRKKDVITDDDISYNFKDKEQCKKVCIDLQRQLGPEYTVIIPKDDYDCIKIKLVKEESK